MDFQRRSERMNGVILLDALGEDIPEGGSDISEGSLAVPLCLGIPGPGNIRRDLDADLRRREGLCFWRSER